MTLREVIEALDADDWSAFLEHVGELEPIDSRSPSEVYDNAEKQPATPEDVR